tara:strand:- start:84 stop:659 length:576 start_codon:yes stop_codon:yes gene_type:complete
MKNFKQYYLSNEGIASTLAGAADTAVDKAQAVAGDIQKGAEAVMDPGGVVSGEADVPNIKELKTFEELKEVLTDIAQQKHRGKVKDAVVGGALDQIPGIGIAKTIGDVIKAVVDKPDEVKTQTGSVIDKLDMDDQLATIIADPVEDNFLAHVLNKIEKETGPIPADWDINNELKQYLSTKFSGRTVTGNQA